MVFYNQPRGYQFNSLVCHSINRYSLVIVEVTHDTKLLISWKLLDVIIYFNNYCEALFNMLFSAINRLQSNKIPWRYKVLNVCI